MLKLSPNRIDEFQNEVNKAIPDLVRIKIQSDIPENDGVAIGTRETTNGGI